MQAISVTSIKKRKKKANKKKFKGIISLQKAKKNIAVNRSGKGLGISSTVCCGVLLLLL